MAVDVDLVVPILVGRVQPGPPPGGSPSRTWLYCPCDAKTSDQPFFSTQKRQRLRSGCLSRRCVLRARTLSARWAHTGQKGQRGDAKEEGEEEEEGDGDTEEGADILATDKGRKEFSAEPWSCFKDLE